MSLFHSSSSSSLFPPSSSSPPCPSPSASASLSSFAAGFGSSDCSVLLPSPPPFCITVHKVFCSSFV